MIPSMYILSTAGGSAIRVAMVDKWGLFNAQTNDCQPKEHDRPTADDFAFLIPRII